MPRCDDIIKNIGKKTIFCDSIGFGEQGYLLSKMPKSIFIAQDSEQAQNMSNQLDALGKANVVVDNFNKFFTLSTFQSNNNKNSLIKGIFKLCTEDAILITTPRFLFCFLFDIKSFSTNIVNLNKNDNLTMQDLEKRLISIGYTKVESVNSKGEFAKRGDIVDIFNISDDQPTRLDFFDTEIDDMFEFDSISFEKIKQKTSFTICPNKLSFFLDSDNERVVSKLNQYSNIETTFAELVATISRNEEVPLEFLLPFSDKIVSTQELNLPIIISGSLQFENKFNTIFADIQEKLSLLIKNKNIEELYKNCKKITNLHEFYEKNSMFLIFFNDYNSKFTDTKNFFNKKSIIDVEYKSTKLPSFLFNLEALQIELGKHKNKKMYLCLNSKETFNSIKKIFNETKVKFSQNVNNNGIILTELKIPYNICFNEDEIWYIGSTNFAHKKTLKKQVSQTIKYLPKANEYVVHSIHGIGKCHGLVTVKVSGVEKEFFKIVYRGGDVVYVPYENADCLSLYMADGENVTLNKLGGKEFFKEKEKAIKSIEDMSEELLNLYALRKKAKGFKYPEDDYIYTEFENSFQYEETSDQLQAIQDIKNDMCSGKVMDRLICGDVGFGKTEVAMRALFKAVEAGKQVAILAPTTILSLQHFMSVKKRTEQFGIRVEMLNRFKTSKEQKLIVEDLKQGKIDVICGTHRLLSKDVVFLDLGLLILDEEQRFGVKAKEQIKQIKNNVNVLSLSATPIPRTLSMTLMSIRDISIINTPPVNRLPVQTYVMTYNEQIILNAINDEINRGGQVLIVYNNIENIYHLAETLKSQLSNKAKFDVAHGQMSEIALEHAVKRLYDKETNVFVSTTLIENGVDLPSANTLVVIDSDKLGLSQMYQLRGRVGRNSEQAYAYFTYNKDKTLTEESASRLQAIAENTELGSGFKIAMRDLQIRGAGELLGKVQHGHLIKIGYDMYMKLLNETLKKLKGENVETIKEVKLDIAITSKIPNSFIADESERLKIIAKIANISTKDDARNVLNSLLNEYGKLPNEIYQLCNLAVLKSLASKNNVSLITIQKTKMSIAYYSDIELQKLLNNVSKFKHFKFENKTVPTISVSPNEFSIQTALNYFIEFLSN